MTKHPASQEKKEPEQSKPGMELPKPTPEQQEKLSKIQKELDTFKEKCLKTRTDITGMSLLPPLQPRPGETINPNEIHIFILIDDAKVEGLAKGDLIDKSTEETTKIAKEINENFKPQVMLITELKEACFDAKYDIIQMVATSALFYDKGLLSALKVAELHKNMAIKKFEKYVVSYIAVGSLFRGDAAPNDIDVAIVIDDTDVKKMSRFELRDKLRAIIINMGYEASQITGVKAQFHIQTYILTDFWESVKDANPVIFTMLRDGVPLYDRGVFMPWKLLLQMGRIKPSPEAIDMQMDIAEKLLDRIKGKMLSIVVEDIYYSVLNPAQAVLMLYGVNPPTPLETIELMEEIFVKKEKVLEEKYVKFIEKVRELYKNVEHGKIKEVSGTEIDSLVKEVREYLERVKKLFSHLEKRAESESIDDVYNACLAVTRDLFNALEIKEEGNIEISLKKVVDKGEIPRKYLKTLQKIIKARDAKLSKAENEKLRREARLYIKSILEFVQHKRGFERERTKLRFKYGDKQGEIYIVNDKIFIIKDLKEKEIIKGNLNNNGMINNIVKSSQEELENEFKNIKQQDIFLKDKTLESLKEIIGKEIEILIG